MLHYKMMSKKTINAIWSGLFLELKSWQILTIRTLEGKQTIVKKDRYTIAQYLQPVAPFTNMV